MKNITKKSIVKFISNSNSEIMKYFLLVTISILFNSCGDDDIIDPHREYDYGSVTALKNGEQWSAEIHGVEVDDANYFYIDINRYNNLGFRRESLNFSMIPKSITSGTVIDNCNCELEYQSSLATLSHDGDVVCDRYDVYEEATNTIEITNFNESTNEFSGSFSVTFVIDPNRTKCDPNAPDTIRFKNGKFNSKITR